MRRTRIRTGTGLITPRAPLLWIWNELYPNGLTGRTIHTCSILIALKSGILAIGGGGAVFHIDY